MRCACDADAIDLGWNGHDDRRAGEWSAAGRDSAKRERRKAEIKLAWLTRDQKYWRPSRVVCN